MTRKGHWVNRDGVLVPNALNVSVREHSLDILKSRLKLIILVKDKADLQFLVDEILKDLLETVETQSDEIEARWKRQFGKAVARSRNGAHFPPGAAWG